MPTPTKGPRLGGSPSHERMILANLARSLFSLGRIRTTEAKAKRLRPQAERLITFAKRGDVAARRQVLTVIRDKDTVHKLFAEIAPRFADRSGGYTRILKLGPRPGDAAPMVVIELVEQGEPVRRGEDDEGQGGRRRRFGRGRSAAADAEEAPEGSNRAARRAAARRRGGAAAAAAGAEGAEGAAAAGEREDEDLAPNVPTDAEIEAGMAPLEAAEEHEADLDEDEETAEEAEAGAAAEVEAAEGETPEALAEADQDARGEDTGEDTGDDAGEDAGDQGKK